MRIIVEAIEKINHWQAQIMSWISLALVILMSFESIARYAFDSPTKWGYDTVIMMGTAMYAFAWPYVHKLNAHIRVDIFYSHLSKKGKALMDVICCIFLFFPLVGALTYGAFNSMIYAWVMNEKSKETTWYPLMGPIRSVFFIGLVLFMLQGIIQFIKDVRVLRRTPNND